MLLKKFCFQFKDHNQLFYIFHQSFELVFCFHLFFKICCCLQERQMLKAPPVIPWAYISWHFKIVPKEGCLIHLYAELWTVRLTQIFDVFEKKIWNIFEKECFKNIYLIIRGSTPSLFTVHVCSGKSTSWANTKSKFLKVTAE